MSFNPVKIQYIHDNGVLTIISELDKNNRTLTYNFSICSPVDKPKFNKNLGFNIALGRMKKHPIILNIPTDVPMAHFYLSLMIYNDMVETKIPSWVKDVIVSRIEYIVETKIT